MKPQKTTILDRWLAAMRTPGLYQQVRSKYCDAHGFCGLGVLANEGGMLDDDVRAAYSRYLSHRGIGALKMSDMDAVEQLSQGVGRLLLAMMVEQGLGLKHAEVLSTIVPRWNDMALMSLSEIADHVEAMVEEWKANPKADPVDGIFRAGPSFKVRRAAHV